MKPKVIKTKREYSEALARVESLMDAKPGSAREEELGAMVAAGGALRGGPLLRSISLILWKRLDSEWSRRGFDRKTWRSTFPGKIEFPRS
jgi:hypothetical protein